MALRLNDIEAAFRIKAEQGLKALDGIVEKSVRADNGLKRLNDTAGRLGGNFAKADRDLGKFGRGVNQAAQSSEAAFRLIETSSGKSLAGLEAATTGVLVGAGQVALLGASFGGLSGVVTKLTASFVGLGVALSTGVLIGLILVAAAATKTAIELNKISKATGAINDGIAKSPALAKFRAESAALTGTLKQLEKGTISAKEATAEFNRFGLQSADQARARIASLDGVIDRLGKEKQAESEANQAKQKRLEIETELDEREAARAREFDIAQAEEARGAARAGQVRPVRPEVQTGPVLSPTGRIEPFQTQAAPIDKGLLSLLEGTDLDGLTEKAGTLQERLDAIARFENGETFIESLDRVDAGIRAAGESAERLEQNLATGIASAVGGLVDLGTTALVNMASGFQNAGAAASAFFKSLLSDLARAIARALILEAILAAVGGPGSKIGKFLGKGGLFADPSADQMARFEGQRFVDLFFQGVTREMGNARDRIDASLTDNRNLVENRSGGQTVIVNEASPETTVEWTDRRIEPRVRARKGQRTGQRLDVVGNPI